MFATLKSMDKAYVCTCISEASISQILSHGAMGLTAGNILETAVSNKVFIIIYYHVIMHATCIQTRAKMLFCFIILRTMACLIEIFSTTHIDPRLRVPCFSTLRKPQPWGIALIRAGS
jgi:hypothetical protein